MTLRFLLSRGHCKPKSMIVSLCSLTKHHEHLCSSSPSPLPSSLTPHKSHFHTDLNKGFIGMRPSLYPPIDLDFECGGSSIVKRANTNTEVLMCANFALKQINLKEGLDLHFSRVIGAESSMVSGIMYNITLQAMDGGERKFYFAQVHYCSFRPQLENRLSLKHWYEWKPSPKTIKKMDAKKGMVLAPPHNIDHLKKNIPTEHLLSGRRAILKELESLFGVQACAKFAVDTMNSTQKLNLQFSRVFSSTSVRDPQGEMYDIILEAKNGRKRKFYIARVHDDLAPVGRTHRELVNWYEWKMPTPKTTKSLDANEGMFSGLIEMFTKKWNSEDSPDEDVKTF